MSTVESTAGLIAARDFAQQIYDLALLRALITVGRDMVESATDTSEDVNPQRKIEEAEMSLYTVAEQGEATGNVREFKTAAAAARASASAVPLGASVLKW